MGCFFQHMIGVGKLTLMLMIFGGDMSNREAILAMALSWMVGYYVIGPMIFS